MLAWVLELTPQRARWLPSSDMYLPGDDRERAFMADNLEYTVVIPVLRVHIKDDGCFACAVSKLLDRRLFRARDIKRYYKTLELAKFSGGLDEEGEFLLHLTGNYLRKLRGAK